ncbi:hypothetical protein JTE90_027767 [Oedothorax gibbosus]|uniref:Uncharacterized protein n=1 Tax=Oedothorax gibbosus TaxID=931172 RepID=A0AAV6V5Y3_9ARAC|nr:hypothetical protein JTE90_027767 [Oedothorax gibbosus]
MESETASKTKEVKENKIETEESMENSDRKNQTSMKLKKNIEDKEKEGYKSIESVSQIASKNKEPAEKGIDNEEKKSTLDQSRSAELHTDSHQSNNKEKDGPKSNESLNETFKNKEPEEKRVENNETKSIPDQSRSAEKSTDFHENSGKDEGNQHRINLEMLKNLLIFIKTTAKKKRERNESRRIFESRSANLPTYCHQNNRKEQEHKSNKGVSENASKNKKPAVKGIENEKKNSSPDQSRSTDLHTDSHHKNSKEKERQKSNRSVNNTTSKNKEPVEKGIKNEEKKSGPDQSTSNELPTDSHQNNSKEKDLEKLNEGVSENSSKNKKPAVKGIENEKKNSSPDQSRSTDLHTDSHHKNSKEKERQKSNRSVNNTTSKNKEPVEKGIKNEEKKSGPDQSTSNELPTDSHQNNSKEKDLEKLNEGVSENSSKNKKPAVNWIENEKKNSAPEPSRTTDLHTDSHHKNSKEKERQKSNRIVSNTASKNKEPVEKGIKNEEKKSRPDQSTSNELPTGSHQNNSKEIDLEKSYESLKEKTSEIKELMKKRYENELNISTPDEYKNVAVDSNHHEKSCKDKEKGKSEKDERKKWTKILPCKIDSNLRSNNNITNKENKTLKKRHMSNNCQNFKTTRLKDNGESEKEEKKKREIKNLLGTKHQPDELRVEGTLCNNDLMFQQNPFNIENDSQSSPESALNHELREQQSSLFPSQPIIDTKSKDKQTLIQKGLEHNEYFFSENKDVFPNEDHISVNENQELSFDSLPGENIILFNNISACELLFHPINVSEYLSSLSNFGIDHKNETEISEIDRHTHELVFQSSHMSPHSPFNLEETDNDKSLETQNCSEKKFNKYLKDSRRVLLKARRRNKRHQSFDYSQESKVAPCMQPNSKDDFIKQVKNEVVKSLNDSVNNTSKPKLDKKQDEPLHPELNAFADVKIIKTESERLLKQTNLLERVETNQTVMNFSNNEETMVNKCNDNNINQIPNLLISNTLETSLFPSFNNDSVTKKIDVSANTDKEHEIQSFPKDIYKKSALIQRKSEIRNFIRQPTFRYEDAAKGSADIEIPETQVNQQKYKTVSEEIHSINRQISRKSSIESIIDEVCSIFSHQSIDDSDFESKPQKAYNAVQSAFFNRKVIESSIVNDKRKEASTKNIKEFVSKLDEQLNATSQPKNRRKAKTQECTSLPISSKAKDPDFTSDSPNFCSGLFETKQRSEMTSKNISSSFERRTQLDQALKIIDQNYDSNATKATEILKVEATNNGNQLVKSIESLTLENQATTSNTTNPFLRADTQRDQISEVNNISSPNCSTYTTKGVATQISNEVSYITGDFKPHSGSGEGLMVQQGNFVFQCALNEKSKCRLQFSSESNSVNTSDPELFKYNLVFERDAFKKGRY